MVKNFHFETLYKILSHNFCLDIKNILEKLSIKEHPVGMGGCHSLGTNYDCCEYNITIFDGKKQEESVLEFDGVFIIFIMEHYKKYLLIFYYSITT